MSMAALASSNESKYSHVFRPSASGDTDKSSCWTKNLLAMGVILPQPELRLVLNWNASVSKSWLAIRLAKARRK